VTSHAPRTDVRERRRQPEWRGIQSSLHNIQARLYRNALAAAVVPAYVRPLVLATHGQVRSRGRGRPCHTWSGRRGSPARLKALTAEDGAALRGTEGDGGRLSASRAGGLGLNLGVAVGLSRCGGRAEDRNSLGFASLATLGFVLELFIVKKKLFPGSENEITPTVDTFQHLVLKFH
jgi:hypothetical protein